VPPGEDPESGYRFYFRTNDCYVIGIDSERIAGILTPLFFGIRIVFTFCMKSLRRQTRIVLFILTASWHVHASGAAETPKENAAVVSADFLNQAVRDDQTFHLTLPDGRQVIGRIDEVQRFSGGIAKVRGKLQHPESGEFTFERQHHEGTPGALLGSLKFDSKPTQWKIEPDGAGYKMAESPVEDAFRPRAMQMPTPDKVRAQTGMSREQAEESLRKDLKIEKTGDGKLRIGAVELDKRNRCIHFPAMVNMTSGTIEYALVASTGKSHEAMFTTDASPRDIHLAMLLLGIQPAKFAQGPDKGLLVPATAAVDVTVGWETNGPPRSLPLASLTKVADVSADKPAGAMKDGLPWLYNGSRFNEAGFGAVLEGSIISLIADEMALVNNSRIDRENDEIHIPNTELLPAKGAPVTITLSQSPTPSQKSTP